MIRYLCFALTICLMSLPVLAQKESVENTNQKMTLTVNISGLKNTNGLLHVLLFSEKGKKGFPRSVKDAEKYYVYGISSKKQIVTFSDLPLGIYAVSLYHDENANNKFDTYWYGKPREGAAMSNNPRPRFRSPRFNEAQFTMKVDTSLDLNLWYP